MFEIKLLDSLLSVSVFCVYTYFVYLGSHEIFSGKRACKWKNGKKSQPGLPSSRKLNEHTATALFTSLRPAIFPAWPCLCSCLLIPFNYKDTKLQNSSIYVYSPDHTQFARILTTRLRHVCAHLYFHKCAHVGAFLHVLICIFMRLHEYACVYLCAHMCICVCYPSMCLSSKAALSLFHIQQCEKTKKQKELLSIKWAPIHQPKQCCSDQSSDTETTLEKSVQPATGACSIKRSLTLVHFSPH